MATHWSHLSILSHVVVEATRRSPPCLIAACRSIHMHEKVLTKRAEVLHDI